MLGKQLTTQQLQQLLGALLDKLGDASPQHITNSIWAIASLGQRVPQAQLQQLAAAIIEKRSGGARAAACLLWSVAKLGERLPQQQVGPQEFEV